MCDLQEEKRINGSGTKTVPVDEAAGMVLAHDITEIRPGEFKGRAFKKGHIVREEDITHLRRLGKEYLFLLDIGEDEIHENDAAYAIAKALAGEGVNMGGEPSEGKINLVASRDGLLKINRDALLRFNMLGEVMCATMHDNSVVKKGEVVAGTRAIPLVVKKSVVEQAIGIAKGSRVQGFKDSSEKIKDAFAPVITEKIKNMDGEILGIHYAPDDAGYIKDRIKEFLSADADLIITTGGMSVDPDDVTRFAIRDSGAEEITYGSSVLPGAMFLIAYIEKGSRGQGVKGSGRKENHSLEPSNPGTLESFVPVLGIPACGMYSHITVFDLILPRVLAGEKIGRRELAELGHGGLCMNCKDCRYPVCPFGK